MWLGHALKALRRVGLGGQEENLDEARKIMGKLKWIALLATIQVVAGVVLIELSAPAWRELPLGLAILNLMVFFAFAACLICGVKASYHQWAKSGSTAGLFRWTVLGFPAMALLMLTVHWAWS